MELLKHIKKYIEEIECINNYFKNKYNTSDVLRSVRLKEIAKEGIALGGEYYFHGIGCRILFSDKVINFDYSDGKVGGMGVYDFIDYLKSIGEKFEENEIETELNKLVAQGKLIYTRQSGNKPLYYLPPNFQKKR